MIAAAIDNGGQQVAGVIFEGRKETMPAAAEGDIVLDLPVEIVIRMGPAEMHENEVSMAIVPEVPARRCDRFLRIRQGVQIRCPDDVMRHAAQSFRDRRVGIKPDQDKERATRCGLLPQSSKSPFRPLVEEMGLEKYRRGSCRHFADLV
ncbi:hypothetical protein ACFQY5_17305 [Paeniroseomonas aquatica]|uniref:hypothetical protein n=1 Tax=Paeniroseomonas aquatica TaxID=373043 RepID=UPI00360B89C9